MTISFKNQKQSIMLFDLLPVSDQVYNRAMSVVWSKSLSQLIKDKVKSCNFER